MTVRAHVLFSTSFISIRRYCNMLSLQNPRNTLMKFFVRGTHCRSRCQSKILVNVYNIELCAMSYDLLSCNNNIRKKPIGKNHRTCLARLSSLIWKSISHINLNLSRTRAFDTYSFVRLDARVYFPKHVLRPLFLFVH